MILSHSFILRVTTGFISVPFLQSLFFFSKFSVSRSVLPSAQGGSVTFVRAHVSRGKNGVGLIWILEIRFGGEHYGLIERERETKEIQKLLLMGFCILSFIPVLGGGGRNAWSSHHHLLAPIPPSTSPHRHSHPGTAQTAWSRNHSSA